jgi:hypothetical protein
MAFERITLAAGPRKAPAGLTITQRGKAVVALRKDLVAKAGFKKEMTFAVLLGVDDDHGKLRIVRDKTGMPCARELEKTGAFFFNLGMIPAIGVTPSKQRPAEARLIENGVEIDLPPDDGPKLLAPPAPRKELPQPEVSLGGGARRSDGAEGETFNGVTIDLTQDAESVAFKGKAIEVTARQAKFVRLLARPRPSAVGEAFLIGALWDGKPPATAKDQLRTMAADLQKGLSPIKLNLCAVKGVGYQLKDF